MAWSHKLSGSESSRLGVCGFRILICAIATAILLGSSHLRAQDAEDSLYLPALGARALGMGGTSVASTHDLSTAASNPALLIYMTPWHSALDYRHLSARVQGLSIYAVNEYARRELMYGIGLEGICADRRNWPGSQSTSRNWTVQPTLGVARLVSERVAVGASLKPSWWKLYREDDFTVEMDLGVAYPTRWRDVDIVVGAVARDILGAEVSRLESDTALDISVLLGVTGRYYTTDSLWEATLAAELEAVERDYIHDPQGRFRIGGELACYKYNDIRLAGRLGYDGEHVTFGLGLGWRFVTLDWAKTAWKKWGHGQAVSLSINPPEFWSWLEGKFGAHTPTVNWRDSLPLYRGEEFDHYGRSARDQFDAGQYDTAYVLFHNARVFADSSHHVALADGGIARSRLALNRLRAEADSVLRVTLLDSLLHKEREFTDSMYLVLLSQADTCFRRRDYQCALDLMDMILSENPTNAEALNLKGDVQKGRDLEIVFSLVLADSAEREKLLGKALEAYLRILQLDSTHTDGATGKGRIEDKLEAQRYARRALQLYEQGYPTAAQTAFDSAVVKDASLQSVRNFLVGTYSVEADTTSLDEIEKDSTVYPYYLSGMDFNRKKEYQRAIDAFNEVLKYYPNSPAVLKEINEARQMLIRSRQDSAQ